MSKEDRQLEIDQITYKSAFHDEFGYFWTIDYLDCFIPILSLSGIEGKMFKPMAMTFSFVLVGAMIFFTYVPVVSSLFLKPKEENPNSFPVN
jgi:cobalt-zinc-cadmium resistance protein CzcA